MKYIFKLFMMFIVYNGFAQNAEKSKRNKVITFPNGDEAITIIANSESNVIRLTHAESYNQYEMLDLSNHEAVHRSAKKREFIRTDLTGNDQGSYSLRSHETGKIDENENEEINSSGA